MCSPFPNPTQITHPKPAALAILESLGSTLIESDIYLGRQNALQITLIDDNFVFNITNNDAMALLVFDSLSGNADPTKGIAGCDWSSVPNLSSYINLTTHNDTYAVAVLSLPPCPTYVLSSADVGDELMVIDGLDPSVLWSFHRALADSEGTASSTVVVTNERMFSVFSPYRSAVFVSSQACFFP
jgi:hypothetical protein